MPRSVPLEAGAERAPDAATFAEIAAFDVALDEVLAAAQTATNIVAPYAARVNITSPQC